MQRVNYQANLSNFSSIDDLLLASAQYYSRVADACGLAGERSDDGRQALLLQHMANASRHLSRKLEDCRNDERFAERHARIQYTPERPLPSAEDLLEATVGAELVAQLCQATDAWAQIHRELRLRAGTETIRDLHEACSRMLVSWSQQLDKAFQEAQDL